MLAVAADVLPMPRRARLPVGAVEQRFGEKAQEDDRQVAAKL